jgi:hypothetical protein
MTPAGIRLRFDIGRSSDATPARNPTTKADITDVLIRIVGVTPYRAPAELHAIGAWIEAAREVNKKIPAPSDVTNRHSVPFDIALTSTALGHRCNP